MTSERLVLVLGAPIGGCDRAADAVAEALRVSGRPGLVVETLDFFKRFAPRLATLVAVARQSGAALVPDAMCDLAGLAGEADGEPLARELASRAVPALEAFAHARGPAAIVSTSALAAAAAAEARTRVPFAAVSIVCELVPARLWTHPGTDLTCVANEEVRERAVLQGVAFDRVAVTGVPARAGYVSGDDAGARAAGRPPRAVVFLPAARAAVRSAIVSTLTSCGMRADDASDADPMESVRGADVCVCSGAGELSWSAPSAGVASILYGESRHGERQSADLLVTSGAAVAARDAAHLATVASYLTRHPARLEAMRTAARSFGAPAASRVIAERVAGLLA